LFCRRDAAEKDEKSTCCEALPMWEKLDKMIDEFFEGITIADLLKK